MPSPSEAPSREPREPGRLSVTGPHMTAELVVVNHRLEPMGRGVGALETLELPPGLYDVQATVGGAKAYHMVRLTPGGSVSVAATDWNVDKVRFESAAPLTGTSSTHEWQRDPAVEWSFRTTWTPAGAGARADSRLFIFVRTLDPQRYRDSFAQGLELLDCDGRLLAKLEGGTVKIHEQDGWMAFCADLPAGSYLLHRRLGEGIRSRYQPLYLCPGWEAQVFVPSGHRPSLRRQCLIYAPRGTGFVPNESQDKAAESVLDGLRRGCNLASAEQMRDLLENKLERPWLGVLAAHAMRFPAPGAETVAWTRQGRRQTPTYREEDAPLYHKVVERVCELLGDHPDAQALRLPGSREKSPRPFPFPPLLQSSLLLARQAETELGADLIPTDSLTDCVLDSLYTNSVWTGWGPLSRTPRPLQKAPSSPADRRRGIALTRGGDPAGSDAKPGPPEPLRGMGARHFAQPAVEPRADAPQVVDALAIVALNRVRLRAADRASGLEAHAALAAGLAAWTLQKQPGTSTGKQALDVPWELALLTGDLDPETLCRRYGLSRARASQVVEQLQKGNASFIAGLLKRNMSELQPEEQAVTDHLKHRLGPDPSASEAALDGLIEQLRSVLKRLPALGSGDWVSALRDDLLATCLRLTRRASLLAVTSPDGESLRYENPPFTNLFPGETSIPEDWRKLPPGQTRMTSFSPPSEPSGGSLPYEVSYTDVIDKPEGTVLARLYRAVPPDPLPELKDLAVPQKHATCLLTSLDLFDYRVQLKQTRAEEYQREMVAAASRLRRASEELDPLPILPIGA